MIRVQRAQEAQPLALLATSAPTWRRITKGLFGHLSSQGPETMNDQCQFPESMLSTLNASSPARLLSLSICQEVCLFLLNLCFLLFKLFIKRPLSLRKQGWEETEKQRGKNRERWNYVLTSSKAIFQTMLFTLWGKRCGSAGPLRSHGRGAENWLRNSAAAICSQGHGSKGPATKPQTRPMSKALCCTTHNADFQGPFLLFVSSIPTAHHHISMDKGTDIPLQCTHTCQKQMQNQFPALLHCNVTQRLNPEHNCANSNRLDSDPCDPSRYDTPISIMPSRAPPLLSLTSIGKWLLNMPTEQNPTLGVTCSWIRPWPRPLLSHNFGFSKGHIETLHDLTTLHLTTR